MTRIRVEDAVGQEDLLRLRAPVERYLRERHVDPYDVEDLAQETLARVWEARGRVARSVAASYAVATARNLLVDERRRSQLHDRHAHRLVEGGPAPAPDDDVLHEEERAAAARALQVADGVLLDAVAGPRSPARQAHPPPPGARPAGTAARLARARSRARVDYLLALRRVALPSARCRTVLDALSSGDRRSQERVGAARHLLSCDVCTDCAPALLSRSRALFALTPLPWLVLLWEALRRRAQRLATAAGSSAGLAAVLVAVLAGAGAYVLAQERRPGPGPASAAPAAPAPAPADRPPALRPPAGVLSVDGVPLLAPGRTLASPAAAVGRPVRARRVPVQSVPADEGFWVGHDAQHRVWVRLRATGESAQSVRAGQLVTFRGRVERGEVPADLLPAEGRAELVAQGAYVAVEAADLRAEAAHR